MNTKFHIAKAFASRRVYCKNIRIMDPWQFPPKIKTNTAVWPPVFQNYESYKSELDEAITQHPPFGEWLRRSNNSHLGFTVDQLKLEYIKHAKIANLKIHARREAIENKIHQFTTLHDEELQQEAEKMKSKMEAYNAAYENFKTARKGGYKIQQPIKPVMHLHKQLEEMQYELQQILSWY